MRAVLIAAMAFVLYGALAPLGYGWVVAVGVGVVLVWLVGSDLLRARRAKRAAAEEERWARAVLDESSRGEVLRELRLERSRLPVTARERDARLSLAEADLLRADGRPAEALARLRDVSIHGLAPAYARGIRQGRIVAALAAEDLDSARAELDAVAAPATWGGLFDILEAHLALESGDAEAALDTALRIREEAGEWDTKVEARLLKAVALAALGDEVDAMKVLHAMPRPSRRAFAALGSPRVRGLVLKSLEDEPSP